MAESDNRLADVLLDYIWGRREPKRPPMSIAAFARLIDMSHTTIHNWLDGKTKPDADTLLVIAEKTGIPFVELAKAAGYAAFQDPGQLLDSLIAHVDEDFQGKSQEERDEIKHWLQSIRNHETSGMVLAITDGHSGRSQAYVAEERGGEYRTGYEVDLPPGR